MKQTRRTPARRIFRSIGEREQALSFFYLGEVQIQPHRWVSDRPRKEDLRCTDRSSTNHSRPVSAVLPDWQHLLGCDCYFHPGWTPT